MPRSRALVSLMMMFTAGVAGRALAQDRLFEKADQEQQRLQEKLPSRGGDQRRESTPQLTADPVAAARATASQLDAVSALVPSVVKNTHGVFREYQALLDAVSSSAEALRALVNRSTTATPPSPAELARAQDRARAALDALAQGAKAAYAEGRKRYSTEMSLDRPVRLVVSGGVSLGSYQAGVIYYYTRALQHQAAVLRKLGLGDSAPNLPALDPRLRAATGASAGSINAFLAGLEMCRDVPDDPTQSLFYKTWINVGIDSGAGRSSLYDPEQVAGDHVLAAAPLREAVQRVSDFWDQAEGIAKDCSFVFGAPATPLRARRVGPALGTHKSATSFAIPVGTEHFFVDVRAEEVKRPDGTSRLALVARPHAIPQEYDDTTLFPQLATLSGGTLPFSSVASLLLAAAAFPVAFPPISLSYHYTRSDAGAPRAGRFVDGGIFDNNPLGMALQLDDWADSGARGGRFIFLNSGAIDPQFDRQWDGPAPAAAPSEDLLGTFGPFLRNYPNVASTSQLMAALSRDPLLRRRLEMPARHSEVTGEFFASFTAFLQGDFRRFDFYRGMVDARYAFLRDSPLRDLRGDAEIEPSFSSAIFECFKQYASLGSLPKSCEDNKATVGEPLLALFASTMTPFTGDPSTYLDQFQQRLEKNGYHFRDDRLWPKDATVVAALRAMGGDASHRLAGKQSDSHVGLLIDTLAENGLNAALHPEPARAAVILGVTSNGFEAGASFGGIPLFGGKHQLHARAELRLLPYASLTLADQAGALVGRSEIAPYAHLEYSFLTVGSVIPFRFSVGLGPGWELSALWTSSGPYWLGRAALEPGVAVTLLERLELRGGYRIFPRWGEIWLQDISSEPELGVVTQSRGGFIFSLDFRL